MKKRTSDAIWRTVLSVLRENPFHSVLLLLSIVAAIGLSLLPPLVLGRMVDQLGTKTGISWALCVLYFILLVLSGGADSFKELRITVFGQRITHRLRSRMAEKLPHLQMEYFTRHEAGEIASGFVNDVDTVETLFSSGVIGMIADGGRVIGIFAMIFAVSPGLGLILLPVTAVILLFTGIVRKRMRQAQLENRSAVAETTAQIPQTIKNRLMIRVFGTEQFAAQQYEKSLNAGYRAMEQSNFCDSVYSPVINIISAVVIGILMVGAAAGGIAGELFGLSVGGAVMTIAYVTKLFSPLESMGMEIQNIQSAGAGLSRIRTFLDADERPLPDLTLTQQALRRQLSCGIVLDRVNFGYGEKPVLQDCSLTLLQGEKLTLEGRTGCGKSTVLRLVLGLYAPDAGRVLLCGADAISIPDKEKKHLIGYVSQSFYRLTGTVAAQLTLGDTDIGMAEVTAACRCVGLHEIIESLENGYDTVCTEELFSKGQWQLLSIARAIVTDPAILLLDEITADLDPETEKQVLSALENAGKERTVLAVSHRRNAAFSEKRLLLEGCAGN